MNRYMRHRKPVVLVGAYSHHNLTQGVNEDEWGWEGMKRKFGHVKLPTVVRGLQNKGGVNRCQGIGLCEGRDEYFLNENRQCGNEKQHETRMAPYPHDLSLEKTLKEMYDVDQKPLFFVENLLLPLREGGIIGHRSFLGLGVR
jgi:hypothetical protein